MKRLAWPECRQPLGEQRMATAALLEKNTVEVAEPLLTLKVEPVLRLDDERFFAFCQLNSELRIERNAQGEIIIMPPAGGITSAQNAWLTSQLVLWTRSEGSGIAFDSSTGFILPNGAIRSPDSAWVRKSRLAFLAPDEWSKFLPLCPDFVIELTQV
jgi:Uma2 family endonuclease